jgi:hypothetical protein
MRQLNRRGCSRCRPLTASSHHWPPRIFARSLQDRGIAAGWVGQVFRARKCRRCLSGSSLACSPGRLKYDNHVKIFKWPPSACGGGRAPSSVVANVFHKTGFPKHVFPSRQHRGLFCSLEEPQPPKKKRPPTICFCARNFRNRAMRQR